MCQDDHLILPRGRGENNGSFYSALEAQLPTYWVPILKSLYNLILSVTQGPTIWVPGLLGVFRASRVLAYVGLVRHN